MSTPIPADPAKLVIGIFTGNRNLFAETAEKLSKIYGPSDIISGWMPFNYTNYYEPEMGQDLQRRMISFEVLIKQDDLADIKYFTNTIEKELSSEEKRTINIDPGYMVMSRFVLATGKDFAHRIHIGGGIYADLTLLYKDGGFKTLPWTYPDYADSMIFRFLKGVRTKYISDLKNIHQKQTGK